MPKGQCHLYTDEQKQFLELHCHLPRRGLTDKFNGEFGTHLSQGAITSYCKRYGFLSGRTGRFEKGQKPWNTDTKGVCKPNSGSFKKGHLPGNAKPLGHERVDSKDGHILVKVEEPNPYTGANTRYRPKHHVIWEQHHGLIPKGNIIRFKDGNNQNCDIRNLICVSKFVNLRMNKNGVNQLPDELKETGRMIAELEAVTFEKQKNMVCND